MKNFKTYLFILSVLACCQGLYGQEFNKQHTYLDAVKLAQLKDSIANAPNPNDIIKAFEKVTHKYGNVNEMRSNPFLRSGFEHIDSFYKMNPLGVDEETGVSDKQSATSTGEQTPVSLSAANWQAAAINGIAGFMAGRFKQETLHLAIDRMFHKMIKTKEDSVLIAAVFPKTFEYINELYGTGSYYTADLLLLRQVAQNDMEQLPYNIAGSPETVFPKLKDKPQIKDALLLGSYIIEYSKKEQPLDRLLSSLANEEYSSGSTVYKILNLADLISQALLNKENSEDKWVNPISILPATSSAFQHPEIKYFYGLLYQQLIQIPEFKQYLGYDTDDIVSIAAKIQGIIRFVTKLNNTYEYIRSKDFNLKSSEEIFTYISDINHALYSINSNLVDISGWHLNDSIFYLSANYISLAEALMNKDYQKVVSLLIVDFGKYLKTNTLSASRNIAFISQLATVKDKDEMEKFLNSYALPIGGSSIKRHSKFNISINGYVGATGGWETAFGSQAVQTKGNIGLAAPIGISTTFCKGYLTAFASVIDLGSIVNQRLNNDTTSYSDLKFEQFFTMDILTDTDKKQSLPGA